MFTIRNDQLNGFREAANPGLCARIAQALTAKFPRLVSAHHPVGLKDFCYDGINEAVSHQFRDDKNVYIFVAAMLVFGKGFDTSEKHRWCWDIFRPKGLREDLAARLLELRIYMETGVQV